MAQGRPSIGRFRPTSAQMDRNLAELGAMSSELDDVVPKSPQPNEIRSEIAHTQATPWVMGFALGCDA